MRRTVAATAVALSLAASVLPAGASYADGGSIDITPPAAERLPEPVAPTAEQALDLAAAAIQDPQESAPAGPDATLALRDLFAALPRLAGEDRERAEALLARPTHGTGDPYHDGYTARATRQCGKRICLHWVRRTADRATGKWARKSLRTMNAVWRTQVGRLGYRRPVRDGRRGGNRKFDVYLADVGAEGLYGYCAPEYRQPKPYRRLASGYCVLDNDFARSQFGGARPADSLRVTAAHEFFHAVQFAYDFLDDPWLMEASATWMEERYADDANDSRQYLAHGQLREPAVPLDRFARRAFSQYGNWAFFEYLSQRFGTGIVRRIWSRAGHGRGDGGDYSIRAIREALPRSTSFATVYAQFALANTMPARSYSEGRHWPTPVMSRATLGGDQQASGAVTLDHLTNRAYRITPRRGLRDRKWQLRIAVDGPPRRTSPAVAVAVQHRNGEVRRSLVRLDKAGRGHTVVPFNRSQTRRVLVAVANSSTRFDCRGRYRVGYSCGGSPKDDNTRFDVTFRTFASR